MKLTIEKDGWGILDAPPTPAILRVIRQLEGRRFNLKAGGTKIEATKSNIELLSGAFPLEISEPSVAGRRSTARRGVYNPRTEPMPHQLEASNKLRSVKHAALFMEQGTGKTLVAIDRAGELWMAGKISAVLVVAPKGVHRQWIADQLPLHSGIPFRGAYWPLKEGEWNSALALGDTMAVFTINIDAARTPKGKAMCLDYIAEHHGQVLMIVDESHSIKNSASQRWKAVDALGKLCDFRAILTGTPIARSLLDAWSQYKWLDEEILGYRYASAFKNEYCIMGGFQGKVIIGHRNVERFRERVERFTYRVSKEEIGITPARSSGWEFDMTTEQRRVIRGLKRDLFAAIDSGEVATAANAAVAVMKMQQVSNGFYMDDNGQPVRIMEPAANPRIQALIELISSRSGKGIIWARFREDITAICEALSGAGLKAAAYHGGTPDKERVRTVERFLQPQEATDSVDFFVANPGAGGTGLNLQGACDYDVFYSNSDNSIERWQAEARIHRIGTCGIVTHFDLVAPFSPDRLILRRHAAKKSISEMALDDVRRILEEEM